MVKKGVGRGEEYGHFGAKMTVYSGKYMAKIIVFWPWTNGKKCGILLEQEARDHSRGRFLREKQVSQTAVFEAFLAVFEAN